MVWMFFMAVALGGPEVTLGGASLTLKPEAVDGLSLTITADSARFDLDVGRGMFEGSVRASRGDIHLSADKAEVVLGDGTHRAVITGSVVVTQGEHRATGEKAVVEGALLVLTGHPMLVSPSHKMVGERMVFRVGERTVECDACTITVADRP
jgi:lipopolysaccharide export system protein LptA